MSRKILFTFLVIATFLTSSLHAATYEDGDAAYEARDFKEAASIWGKLAEQGDAKSQLKMAEMYTSGSGVKKDHSAALKLYNQAVEQGSAEAQLRLGLIYMSGELGVKPDSEKARELYLKAANQGYAKAQYYYGVSYFRGEGVPTDYVQGHAWMHVAAVMGYEPAKNYAEMIKEVLSEANLEKSKNISDQILAEMK